MKVLKVLDLWSSVRPMMVQNAMARVLVGVWCAQGLVSPPPRGLRPVSGGRVAAAEGASAEAPVAVVAELPLPVRGRREGNASCFSLLVATRSS